MELQFLGCGDAFGSGGRFNTCFHVLGASANFLIDCGASSMVAMRKFGVDPNEIDCVLLTHLHGDHFGGLPFMLLDAQLGSRREKPLVIAGPPTTEKRLHDTMECLFPRSTTIDWRFDLRVVEMDPGVEWRHGPVSVTPYLVHHHCGAPPFALRVTCDGSTVSYSGDTQWTDSLVDAARDADLFICEAYFHDKTVKFHLDLATLVAHLDEIRPKRLVLTHLGPDMLDRLAGVAYEVAEDGLVLTV
jgi:ribonuclease BN (tRNA processing enzyme)